MKVSVWKRAGIRVTPRNMLPRVRKLTRSFELIQEATKAQFVRPSATPKAIMRHGKPFIVLFKEETIRTPKANFRIEIIPSGGESPIALGIVHTARTGGGEMLGKVKLGFTTKDVIIEGIQGAAPVPKRGLVTNKSLMHTFERTTGEKWANFLIRRVELHARNLGFKHVKIIRPELNEFFQWHGLDWLGDRMPQAETVKVRMLKLYYGVAREMGYHEEGDYLVKNLEKSK